MSDLPVQYVSDETGAVTAVLVPIAVWREVASELETQHLLGSPAMRERLLRARNEAAGVPLGDVLGRLGVTAEERREAGTGV